VVTLRALTEDEVGALLDRAVAAPDGLGGAPTLSPEGREAIARYAYGDARRALNALEVAAAHVRLAGRDRIERADAEEALQTKTVLYDKAGEEHYNVVSAFIKSMRGSDPDAAVYYMVRMLEGGEDPRFVVRRMVIFASEDIGNADPQALVIATAAGQAVDRVGLPECALNLAQAAAYLALSPKSNASTRAITKATAHIREHGAAEPPPHLQDAHYAGAKELGRGEGYRYPHDEPEGVTDQPLAPEGVRGERFYEPTDRGAEAELRKRLERLREQLGK